MTNNQPLCGEPRDRSPLNTIYVDISQIVIGHSTDQLKIPALGSCVGLVIYPKHQLSQNRCAVMGHIMLPESHDKKRTSNQSKKELPAKYSDKAIPRMIEKLQRLGFHSQALEAKLVGGAKMFGKSSDTLDIGKENIKATKNNLNLHNISLVKEFTGGDRGMNVKFIVKDYELIVTPTGSSSVTL
ncbi:MAG: chemotaxis protein CheD [Candidatus Hodarchaeales archaeon]|jgi:chemotaxis protein CheD